MNNFNVLKLLNKANRECLVSVIRLYDKEVGIASPIFKLADGRLEPIAVKIFIGNPNGSDDEIISARRFNTEYEIIDIEL